jgi:hypothetical protein
VPADIRGIVDQVLVGSPVLLSRLRSSEVELDVVHLDDDEQVAVTALCDLLPKCVLALLTHN